MFNTLLAGREAAEKDLRLAAEAAKASMRIALADAREVCGEWR